VKTAPSGRPGGSAQAAEIVVRVQSAAWRTLVPAARALCRRAALAALATADARAAGEIAIVLADNATLHALNRDFRGKDKPTNVLAFPVAEPGPPGAEPVLGDVVIAAETVAAEAAGQGKPISHHLAHLVVHGVLHLLGHTHDGKADARRMETLETRALQTLDIPDPYVPSAPQARPRRR